VSPGINVARLAVDDAFQRTPVAGGVARGVTLVEAWSACTTSTLAPKKQRGVDEWEAAILDAER